MKHKLLTALGVIGLAVAGSALAAGNAAHDHGHAVVETTKLELNAGKKWETDAALRKAMESIRHTMAASLHDIHENRVSAAAYGKLAHKVEDEVGQIVANCKLEPRADAQLHLIVAELLDGAEQMAGKPKQAKRMNGAVKVIGALEKYS
ncbi:MAG: hypothetical protein Q8S20_10650, partial [Sulfuritalea sp.]|nr:hypothetical protein [Sulfuritalea sp.]